MLSIFSMLHKRFIDQLRAKVLRGMEDGFARGQNLYSPSVGYKLVPLTDDTGRAVLRKNGQPRQQKVIDEADVSYILEGFRL
jgi:hypothetical protein